MGPMAHEQGGEREPDFATLDKEFQQLHDLGFFKGGKTEKGKGKGQAVAFDKAAARRRRFSERSIALAEESAAFANELTAALSEDTSGVPGRGVDVAKYPTLKAFFEAAAQHRPDEVDLPEADTRPDQPAEGTPTELANDTTKRWVCGWYTSPRPWAAAPYVRHHNIPNPDATLRSWGYHPTWDLAGGGYTRPQTWDWWTCGWFTFRDHAIPDPASNSINVQDYAGFRPRGEPNPEVYLSGPWPYADWPAYVYWWHVWGPGGP
jgi:hypothetical protein